MNRDIKFRGYARYHNKWVYGYLIKTQNSWGDEFEIVEEYGIEHVDGWEYSGQSFIVEADSIGQYTGLKDNNGNEIYEGDILKIAYHDDYNYKIVGEVTWNDKAYFEFRDKIGGQPLMNLFTCYGATKGEMEVIGNTFEASKKEGQK